MSPRRRANAIALASLAALATLTAGRAQARVLGWVTVEAGEHARRNTPVPLTLPPELASKSLELRGPGGALPLTVHAPGEAVFVVPAMKKGQRLRLELSEARQSAPRAGAEVTSDEEGLWLSVGGKRLLRYQAKSLTPEGIRQEYLRGGYLHPVLTPSGVQVTDDYPADHRHHHGIWTAWTTTLYEGRKPDFWNMGGKDPQKRARKDHVSLDDTFSGSAATGFTARLSSTDLGATPPRVVLDERWKVIAYRTHARGTAPYHLFDLEWTDTVVGTTPLEIPEYRYGGLGVRGHIDWLGEENTTFLTSEGKDRKTAENTPARWCHMGGKVKSATGAASARDKLAGIAALDHPQNFRHPQPLRISPNQPYFVYAPMKAGPFTLQPGKPYVSRHRFVVSDGPADAALLERLFQDYAQPPQAKVELSR